MTATRSSIETTGSGDDFDVTWDGLDGADAYPDGTYTVTILAEDDWANTPATKTDSITIDTVPAELTVITPDETTDRWFSPNGDGSRDSVSWTATTAEPGSIVWRVLDGDGDEVRRTTVSKGAGAAHDHLGRQGRRRTCRRRRPLHAPDASAGREPGPRAPRSTEPSVSQPRSDS